MISLWNGENFDEMAEMLHAAVHAGASIGFILPFAHEDAARFWRDVLRAVEQGTRRVLVARHDNKIAGTVQIDFAMPPNQPHRVEVKKLLVHPAARRLGIARKLMLEIESQTKQVGRTLMVLDTVTSSPAEALYRSLDYKVTGVIPGFAWNFDCTKIQSTTVMYKQL